MRFRTVGTVFPEILVAAVVVAGLASCDAGETQTEPEVPAHATFKGRPIAEWVEQLRKGPVTELDEAGSEALPVWKVAARDPKAVGWVRHAMRVHFRDQAWVGDVYVAMLDEPFPLLDLGALASNPAAFRRVSPDVMNKIREWARAEGEHDRATTEYALSALLSVNPAPEGSVDLVRDLWPRSADWPSLRWELLKLLGAVGKAGVPVLIDLWLEDPQVEDGLFWYFTQTNRGTIDGLVAASTDQQTRRRRLATLLIDQAAGRSGHAEHRQLLVEPSMKLLRDPDPDVRRYAIAAIKDLSAEPGVEGAIPILGKLVREEGRGPRMEAAQTLASFGSAALPEIRRAALSDRADVRVAACSALAGLDSFPKDEVDLLLQLAKDEDPQVRRYAVYALGETKLGDRAVVDAILDAREDPETYDWATRALGALGPVADEAIPELRRELTNDDLRKRMQAASTLWAISHDAELVLPVAMAIMRDDKGISTGAYSAMYRVVDGKRIEQRRHYEYPLSARAVKLLGEMGVAARPAVSDLGDLLGHPNRHVRGEALRAIEKLGPVATAAVPALERQIEQADKWQYLVDVLRKVDPEAASKMERRRHGGNFKNTE